MLPSHVSPAVTKTNSANARSADVFLHNATVRDSPAVYQDMSGGSCVAVDGFTEDYQDHSV